ncbi:MAG: T9SS type A sorting domain-containing protein [Bacteroidota bacterium]
MKKHLLLGSALVAAISAFPQAASPRLRQSPVINMTERMAQKFVIMNNMEERSQTSVSSNVIQQEPAPVTSMKTSSIGAVNWNAFTGSMNMFGVLVSTSRPLQYDDELNAVTFVHRRSNTYVPSPTPTSVGANTGVLVAMVSQNWGGTWDSTMIYNDNNNWARYPQGGILKQPLTTNINNALIVATAPITQANTALGWIGNIITVKPLGSSTYNNIQSASSQTFIANTAPYAGPWVAGPNNTNIKMDFLRHDFASTDDGKVRAMGQIFGGNANTPATQDFRGARIVKGYFVSGQPVFTHDSLIPPVRRNSQTNDRLISATQGMAWSEDGMVGYAYFIGSHDATVGSTLTANMGMQPIVARTGDGGQSWIWLPSIDFNLPAFKAPVMDHIVSTRADTTLAIPFFAYWEGMSAVVDSANNLHLVATMIHSPAADPDSTNFLTAFINYDGENYRWAHQPGLRPYIYDFSRGATSAWKVTVIDSMPTEGPGTRPADDGFSANQWAVDADGNKIDIDARIQASRTADGKYILYSWSETDTVSTTNNLGYTKWNIFPNVKVRMMHSRTGLVSPTEINATKLVGTSGTNPNVANRAYNFYTSSKCGIDMVNSTGANVIFNLPMTVSNNSALDPATPATHRYASVPIEVIDPTRISGVSESSFGAVSNSFIYPNPANNSAFLAIDLKNNSDVKISVLNMVGQVVKTSKANGQIGANNINIDLSGLAKGIYLVNITADNASATKKLIVE